MSQSNGSKDNQRPLILFTNDDGIESPGLWAAVRAFKDLGDLLVVAPRDQQSGMGRSMPRFLEGRIHEYTPQNIDLNGCACTIYAVEASPAQCVQHGVVELADRLPSLVVSGINYGENTGNGVTISGTVGAALEAASLDIPALAVSLQTPFELHLSYSDDVNFEPSAHFARLFGSWLIEHRARPDDVDVLKVDVPWEATGNTPWRITRISRRRVYWPTRPERVALSDVGRMGYAPNTDPAQAEPDSDVRAIMIDKVVSVSPMSLDMTSRTDLYRLRRILAGEWKYGGH